MNVQEGYNIWAAQYDTNANRTRDMEGLVMKNMISEHCLQSEPSVCLEVGCGTGKNTLWLIANFDKTVSVDFSQEMLDIAKHKIALDTHHNKVTFYQADITEPWSFIADNTVNLITFSLVLEHIENLDFIFTQIVAKVKSGGFVYIGELHPFKQYAGTKARFQTDSGTQELSVFVHNVSDFTNRASVHGFELLKLDEFFDDNNRSKIPRIVGIVLRKL